MSPTRPPSDAAFHASDKAVKPATVLLQLSLASFFHSHRLPSRITRHKFLRYNAKIRFESVQCSENTMAKVYFYYSAMNAGKSTVLLQSSYNYRERGMNTLIFTPEIDTRHGNNRVCSRIGLESEATSFSIIDNLFEICRSRAEDLHCVLVDEAQFLTKKQVRQLTDIADQLEIPVLTYGLRTDFQGHLFEGSMYLLAWADSLVEIKTICHCGRKATMVLRLSQTGNPVHDGDQVKIGGNERYISVCRQHFKEGIANRDTQPLPFNEGPITPD